MAINRTYFTPYFHEKEFRNWTCPICFKGVLRRSEKSLKYYALASALDDQIDEPDECLFMAYFICTTCTHRITAIGNAEYFDYPDYDTFTGEGEVITEFRIYPKLFNPPVHLFQVFERKIPLKIIEITIQAFSLYWMDQSSCANKIRNVLEAILDDIKIPKSKIHSKKRIQYNLHKRIELFKQTNSELAHLIMAIKWIGNTGSHQIGTITHDDLLDGFDLLEHVLKALYQEDKNWMLKLAKAINKKKKPLSKKFNNKIK